MDPFRPRRLLIVEDDEDDERARHARHTHVLNITYTHIFQPTSARLRGHPRARSTTETRGLRARSTQPPRAFVVEVIATRARDASRVRRRRRSRRGRQGVRLDARIRPSAASGDVARGFDDRRRALVELCGGRSARRRGRRKRRVRVRTRTRKSRVRGNRRKGRRRKRAMEAKRRRRRPRRDGDEGKSRRETAGGVRIADGRSETAWGRNDRGIRALDRCRRKRRAVVMRQAARARWRGSVGWSVVRDGEARLNGGAAREDKDKVAGREANSRRRRRWRRARWKSAWVRTRSGYSVRATRTPSGWRWCARAARERQGSGKLLSATEDPVANLKALEKFTRTRRARTGERVETRAVQSITALETLFRESLLPDRKLKYFSEQPLTRPGGRTA